MGSRVMVASVLVLGLATGSPVLAQTAPQAGGAAPDAAAFLQKWDRSGKGLLDLKGVLNAAVVKFGILDKQRRGRLTEQDLGGLLTAQEFAVANPDGDKTIGAEEWFDIARRRFYAANPDNDGSLTVEELRTPDGQTLIRLLQ